MTIAPGRSAEFRTGGTLEAALVWLGTFCWKHARVVILTWLLAALIAGFFASNLTERLLSGAGNIQKSVSLRVDESLRSDFGRGDGHSLILVFRSASLERKPSELPDLLDEMKRRLAERPSVSSVTSESDIEDHRLLPKPQTGHLIIIDLKTRDLLAAEQEVPKLRTAVAPVFAAAKARHGDLDWAITGRAALTYDLNKFVAEDTARAEFRALPLTLVILILAFGSIVSAMLPLLLAFAGRTIALGFVFLLAGSVDVSNMVQSVVTMLSIALGIDYSLFLIHRYRRELERIGAENPGVCGVIREQQAMRFAMAQSGSAVFYSAVTVAIGIGSLLATPLMTTRSIGLGGLLAVLVTLTASLTLVPAFLRLLRPDVLEWPRVLSRRKSADRSRKLWGQWARIIETKPVLAIVTSLAMLVAMATPAFQTRIGFPESEFLPSGIEFSRGMNMLGEMQLKGLVSPIVVVVSDTGKERALTPERTPLLAGFVSRLEQDPRVRFVQGPVRSSSTGRDGTLEEAVGGALARSAFVSDDRSSLLFLLIPSDNSTLDDLRALSKRIPGWLDAEDLSVEVGGQAQYYNDFEIAVSASYPLTIGLVLVMSAMALLLVFRAPLASAKAIVLNLLSVAAGYGVVVLVFQLGHGSELFGVLAPTTVVPIFVPLLIFCIVFGLSMDYEIFLLSRIRAIFDQTGDNARSIREGLADTGSVITSAALIMVAVFGAFAFARDVIVQMIGLGLAVAVFVDATLIRSVLGPALMQVAGRWNWWPGQLRSVR